MIKKFFDWLIPITCMVCGFQARKAICADCLKELPWLMNECNICAAELVNVNIQKLCGECLINPPPIDKSVVLFHYQFPLPSIITQLKFSKKLLFAKPLGNLLANKVSKVYRQQNLSLPECIIPPPLHPARLRTRGYNQALEIARPIAKQLKIPVVYSTVIKIKATAPQTFLNAQERKLNVKNVFQLKKKCNFKHVALVDDVVTTFSTLSELAHLLRKNGIEKIDIWCVAKAT